MKELLMFWNTISHDQQAELRKEIEQIDREVLKTQQALVLNPPSKENPYTEPCTDYAMSGNEEDFLLGKQLIAQGKWGV